MTTVRQRAKATAPKPDKKVVKPVLTNPHILQWPELSQPAQAQIEASLWQLLNPVAEAREHQYDGQPDDMVTDPLPLASTSKLVLDVPTSTLPDIVSAADGIRSSSKSGSQNTATSSTNEEPSADSVKRLGPMSKRAKHREHLRKKVEKRDAHLAPGLHEISLRSGKNVQIPDRPQPEGFLRKLHLDKRQALKNCPAICDTMVIGLNAVTRYLEESIDGGRRELAGLPPVPRNSDPTAKDKLRLFIPTPTRGTRRDRRALRGRLHPRSKADKLIDNRNRVLDSLQDMPPYLLVPSREPALVFAMQDMRSRLEKAIRTPSEHRYLSTINELLPLVEDSASTGDGASEADMAGAEALSTSQAMAKLPTEQIIELLLTNDRSIVEDRDRSLLLSLFSRFDPEWFRLWNLRRQAMARIGQIDRLGRQAVKLDEKSMPAVKNRPLQVIFVAKADINPLQLVQHLLTAVGALNSLNIAKRKLHNMETGGTSASTVPATDIYLVPLSKGAEQKLAGLLALRKVSVLAFTINELVEFKKLVDLVKVHLGQPLSAEWLIPAVNGLGQVLVQQGQLVPTHIKYLQTTTPVDVKALRAEKLNLKKRKREEARDRAATENTSKKARRNIAEISQTQNTSSGIAAIAGEVA